MSPRFLCGRTAFGAPAATEAPASVTPPTIDNTSPQVGDTLTGIPGTWLHVPTSHVYQWIRDGVDIAGGVGLTYLLTEDDLAAEITIRDTATNAAGSDSATSDPTDPVAESTFFF